MRRFILALYLLATGCTANSPVPYIQYVGTDFEQGEERIVLRSKSWDPEGHLESVGFILEDGPPFASAIHYTDPSSDLDELWIYPDGSIGWFHVILYVRDESGLQDETELCFQYRSVNPTHDYCKRYGLGWCDNPCNPREYVVDGEVYYDEKSAYEAQWQMLERERRRYYDNSDYY